MTPEFFQGQIQRLSNVFGGAYKTERTQLIWNEMGNLPDDAFKRIVDRLISECRQAPLLPEFRDQAAVEREKIWSRQKAMGSVMSNLHEFAKCSTCHGSGSVLVRRKDDHSPWAFKCGCPAGRNNPRNFPLYQPSHDFEVV